MAQIKLNTRLVSLEVALQWMALFAPNVQVNNEATVTVDESCRRCGGSGHLPCYNYHDQGVCYGCGGANTMHLKGVQQCALVWVKKNAPGIRKEAREQAKYQAECDKNEAAGHGRVSDATVSLRAQEKAEADRKAAQQSKWDAEKALAADVPVGRHTVSGEVLKLDFQENQFGNRYVMTVKTGEGYILWGSVPSSLYEVNHGDKIEFTATLEVSDRDPKFGFYKRPSKAVITEQKLEQAA